MDWIINLCLAEISWFVSRVAPCLSHSELEVEGITVTGGLLFSWWKAERQEGQMDIGYAFRSFCLTLHHFISAHVTLIKASHAGNAKSVGDRDA